MSAATHFLAGLHYRLPEELEPLSAQQLIAALERLADEYPIVSIEDGLAEDDWEGWAALTARSRAPGSASWGRPIRNEHRTARTRDRQRCRQCRAREDESDGTLTETVDMIERGRAAGYATIVSARSGETEDSFLADFAVGTCAGQIKIGSLAQSERLSKYNQLLRIEEEAGSQARYAGVSALAGWFPKPGCSGPATGR